MKLIKIRKAAKKRFFLVVVGGGVKPWTTIGKTTFLKKHLKLPKNPMTTNLEGGGVKSLVVRPLRKSLFCGFPKEVGSVNIISVEGEY